MRLVTLRPYSEVAFSTNYFHETWHILSDHHGARLLARLMWGLSFQQKPGTVILIYGGHIRPTPFEADPSDPILIMPAGGTNDRRVLRSLQRRLECLGRPHCTVRWHTFGLDIALKRDAERTPGDRTQEWRDYDWISYEDNRKLWNAEKMFRQFGFVCYCAPPRILRHRALAIAQLDAGSQGMDYVYLADRNLCYPADGEVQIFGDYDERRSAAEEARRRVNQGGRRFGDRESWQAAVWAKCDQILWQRRRARRRRRARTLQLPVKDAANPVRKRVNIL